MIQSFLKVDNYFGEKRYMVTIYKDCTTAWTIFGYFHIQYLFFII